MLNGAGDSPNDSSDALDSTSESFEVVTHKRQRSCRDTANKHKSRNKKEDWEIDFEFDTDDIAYLCLEEELKEPILTQFTPAALKLGEIEQKTKKDQDGYLANREIYGGVNNIHKQIANIICDVYQEAIYLDYLKNIEMKTKKEKE